MKHRLTELGQLKPKIVQPNILMYSLYVNMSKVKVWDVILTNKEHKCSLKIFEFIRLFLELYLVFLKT